MTLESYNDYFDDWDSELVSSAEDTVEKLREHKRKLYGIARGISEQFHEDWKAINKTLHYKSRGKLAIRVRRRKRDDSLTIQWLLFWYEGPKDKRKRRTDEIPKAANGHRQNFQKMRGHGLKDWEFDLFREYEPFFAHVRQRHTDIGKQITQLSERIAKKYNGDYTDYSFGGSATAEDGHEEDEYEETDTLEHEE